jgi:hypothetical protein
MIKQLKKCRKKKVAYISGNTHVVGNYQLMIFLEQETTFDQLTLPEKVYKYRNWSNKYHKRILTHNEIYFSAPSDIDEQHECALEADYASVTPEMIHRYAYLEAEANGIMTETEKLKFATATVHKTSFFKKATQENGDVAFKKSLDEQLSIFCVSQHNDNDALWNMFAGGHTGFCAGIHTRTMFENMAILGGGGKVQYYSKEDMPKRMGLPITEAERIGNMLNVIFSLPEIFASEDEYRFFKMNIKDKQATIGVDSIQEIILGHAISVADKKEIIEITTARFPAALILQAQIQKGQPSLVFEKI